MTRLEIALQRIDAARCYSKKLLENVDPADWFRRPAEGVTHIAWQVGHMAVAEYGLALVRIRGVRPEDTELITSEFRSQFGKGSTPNPDPAANPTPDELRRVLDGIHARVIQELRELPDAVLDEPSEPAHPLFSTKHGALMWCAEHEFVHAGQISLLRRLLGHAFLW